MSAVLNKKGAGLHGLAKEIKPVPIWASHLRDCRDSLKWDHSQTIVEVGFGGALTMAIVDTGSC